MSADAIVMMVVAMLVLWGGLVLALLNLVRTPDSRRRTQARRAEDRRPS